MEKQKLMTLKKILIAGIPAGLFLAFINAITAAAGINVFMSGTMVDVKAWIITTVSYYIMLGFLLALIYDSVYKGLKGDNPITKGLFFGVIVWLIQAFPSMIDAFITNPQFSLLVIMKLVTGFSAYPLVGIIIAVAYTRYMKIKV